MTPKIVEANGRHILIDPETGLPALVLAPLTPRPNGQRYFGRRSTTAPGRTRTKVTLATPVKTPDGEDAMAAVCEFRLEMN